MEVFSINVYKDYPTLGNKSIIYKNFIDEIKKEAYIYCGRGSPYGNPYKATEYTLGKAIELHDIYAKQTQYKDLTKELIKLDDIGIKTVYLGCFCKPKACHLDNYMKYLKNNYGVNNG